MGTSVSACVARSLTRTAPAAHSAGASSTRRAAPQRSACCPPPGAARQCPACETSAAQHRGAHTAWAQHLRFMQALRCARSAPPASERTQQTSAPRQSRTRCRGRPGAGRRHGGRRSGSRAPTGARLKHRLHLPRLQQQVHAAARAAQAHRGRHGGRPQRLVHGHHQVVHLRPPGPSPGRQTPCKPDPKPPFHLLAEGGGTLRMAGRRCASPAAARPSWQRPDLGQCVLLLPFCTRRRLGVPVTPVSAAEPRAHSARPGCQAPSSDQGSAAPGHRGTRPLPGCLPMDPPECGALRFSINSGKRQGGRAAAWCAGAGSRPRSFSSSAMTQSPKPNPAQGCGSPPNVDSRRS